MKHFFDCCIFSMRNNTEKIAAQMDNALLKWNANPIDFDECTFQQFVQDYSNIMLERTHEKTDDYYTVVYAAKWIEWYNALTKKYPALFIKRDEDEEDEPQDNNPRWLNAMGLVYEYTGINFSEQWQLTVSDWYAYNDYAVSITNEKIKQIKRRR